MIQRLAGLLWLLAALLPSAATAQASAMEVQRIEWLLRTIEQLPNAQFLRNDTAHSPAEAAGHLRMKWGKAGKRVKTAEDFIRLCASGSTLSGKPYLIQFGSQPGIAAGPYLREKLAAYKLGRRDS